MQGSVSFGGVEILYDLGLLHSYLGSTMHVLVKASFCRIICTSNEKVFNKNRVIWTATKGTETSR